jgi:hypothetical protein
MSNNQLAHSRSKLIVSASQNERSKKRPIRLSSTTPQATGLKMFDMEVGNGSASSMASSEFSAYDGRKTSDRFVKRPSQAQPSQ